MRFLSKPGAYLIALALICVAGFGADARADKRVDWSQYLETPAERAAQARQQQRAVEKQPKKQRTAKKRIGANKHVKKHKAKRHAKRHKAKRGKRGRR